MRSSVTAVFDLGKVALLVRRHPRLVLSLETNACRIPINENTQYYQHSHTQAQYTRSVPQSRVE
eukprot:44414-Amorphochlora_amoeboformis.AAC.1